MHTAQDIMSTDIRTCPLDAPASSACQIMWDQDCGIVPVTRPDTGQLCGIVSDRDICMASFLRGDAPTEIPLASVASRTVHVCSVEDSLAHVQETMRDNKVRRLPVVDDDEHVLGLISMNDLARHAKQSDSECDHVDVAQTLESICESRRPRQAEPQALITSEATPRESTSASATPNARV